MLGDNGSTYPQTYNTQLPGSGAEFTASCAATIAPQALNSKRLHPWMISGDGFIQVRYLAICGLDPRSAAAVVRCAWAHLGERLTARHVGWIGT